MSGVQNCSRAFKWLIQCIVLWLDPSPPPPLNPPCVHLMSFTSWIPPGLPHFSLLFQSRALLWMQLKGKMRKAWEQGLPFVVVSVPSAGAPNICKAENYCSLIYLFGCSFMNVFICFYYFFLIRDPYPLFVYQKTLASCTRWNGPGFSLHSRSGEWEDLRISFMAQGLNSLVVVV